MCLNPLRVRNPTSKYTHTGGQKMLMDVPCNNCAECKKAKRLEYRFRTFYQVQETISNGGYVYFDTLTYRPADVPHISRFVDVKGLGIKDYMCFDRNDLTNFLKLLRRMISYHYGNKVTFKYFLTSEYGTDENYTHRPHYHILFFVNSLRLHPYDLSFHVSKCWRFGRTDGIVFHPRNYVASHVYGVDLGQKDASNFMHVCNYVSKYVTKDSTYQTYIDKRLLLLKDKISEDDFIVLKRSVQMFHLQSQGFGLSYIQNLDTTEIEEIINTGVCRLQDKDKIVVHIPLPTYYKRKLFFELHKNPDKTYSWYPNDLGIKYILHSLDRQYKNTLNKAEDIYYLALPDERIQLDHILNGRSLTEYALYKTLYQYRNVGENNELSYDSSDWVNNIISSYYNPIISTNNLYIKDKETEYVSIPINNLFTNKKEIDYDSFVKRNCITQTTLSRFDGFDKLDALLHLISTKLNNLKNETFNYQEFLVKYHKIVFNYGK